jgi:hypothetical protein
LGGRLRGVFGLRTPHADKRKKKRSKIKGRRETKKDKSDVHLFAATKKGMTYFICIFWGIFFMFSLIFLIALLDVSAVS